jgi:hypothetical protein
MPLLGRNAKLYRAVYPSNLSVSPPANNTSETFTSAERIDAGETARVTYTYSSNSNITALYAVFRWLNSAGSEISRNTVSLTPNTTGTRTDEYTAPDGAYSFQFGIRATSGSTAGTASFSNITERLLCGYAKSVSVSMDVDIIKEYCINVTNPDRPAFIASGNKSFKVSIELLYANDKYAQKILAGDKFDIITAPDGWGSGKPLVTLKNVVLNSWEQSIEQDGVIAESLEGEGDSITLETQT